MLVWASRDENDAYIHVWNKQPINFMGEFVSDGKIERFTYGTDLGGLFPVKEGECKAFEIKELE